jgi:hypothetical protein
VTNYLQLVYPLTVKLRLPYGHFLNQSGKRLFAYSFASSVANLSVAALERELILVATMISRFQQLPSYPQHQKISAQTFGFNLPSPDWSTVDHASVMEIRSLGPQFDCHGNTSQHGNDLRRDLEGVIRFSGFSWHSLAWLWIVDGNVAAQDAVRCDVDEQVTVLKIVEAL